MSMLGIKLSDAPEEGEVSKEEEEDPKPVSKAKPKKPKAKSKSKKSSSSSSSSSEESEATKKKKEAKRDKKKAKKKAKKEAKKKAKKEKEKKSKEDEPKKKKSTSSATPSKKATPAKPKRVAKTQKTDEERLYSFPKEGLIATVKEDVKDAGLFISRVLHRSERPMNAEDYKTARHATNSVPIDIDQICWVQISVKGLEGKVATALAVRTTGDETDKQVNLRYYPLVLNQEKMICEKLYTLGKKNPTFKERVAAYNNRIPLANGLEKYADFFKEICFVSDYYYKTNKDWASEGENKICSGKKLLFSESNLYLADPLKRHAGNLVDEQNLDQILEHEEVEAPQREEAEASGIEAHEGSESEAEVCSGSLYSQEESGDDSDEAEEDDSGEDDEKAEKKKGKKSKPEEDVEPVFSEAPAVQEKFKRLDHLVPLVDINASTTEMKNIITATNVNWPAFVNRMPANQHQAEDSIRKGEDEIEVPIATVEKTKPLVGKMNDNQKTQRPTVQLIQQKEPEKEPEVIMPPKKSGDKRKTEDPSPAASAAKKQVTSEEKKNVARVEDAGTRKPKFTNHSVAVILKKYVSENPTKAAGFDIRDSLREALNSTYSLDELAESPPNGLIDCLNFILPLWFEFECQNTGAVVETKNFDSVVAEWKAQLALLGFPDHEVSITAPKDGAHVIEDCYGLVRFAVKNQMQLSQKQRLLFIPKGKLFKLFPEDDGVPDEQAYKNTLKTELAKSALYSAFLLFEEAKSRGTCLQETVKEREAEPANAEDDLF